MNVCEYCGAGDADELLRVDVYEEDPSDSHPELWCQSCVDDFTEVVS